MIHKKGFLLEKKPAKIDHNACLRLINQTKKAAALMGHRIIES